MAKMPILVVEDESLIANGIQRGERKLIESENWLSTTLKSIGDAVITTDAKGRVNFINPIAQTLTGWKMEDAIGKPLENVFDIVNEKTGERVENPVTKVIREGVVVGLGNHTVLIAKDGTRKFIEDSAAPIEDDDGNILGVVLVFRDITERRQQEKVLAEKNRLIRLLMENVPDQIYVKDREHRFIIVNDACADFLGCRREDAVGKTDADFFLKDLADEYYEDEERIMETGESIVNKEERTGIEGDRWNNTTKIPMYDDDGNIVGIMGLNRDITVQKSIEEALRTSEEKYRQVVENANESIFVLQDYKIQYFNPKLLEMSGYSRDELTSKLFVEFIHVEDRKMLAGRHLKRLKGEEVPHLYSFRFIDKGGNTRWGEIDAVQIIWNGRPATLNFLSDITERKQAEDALRESEQAERHFQEQLTALHEASNELMTADSFDELCRRAIELGRSKLGFDRLGLWFVDEEAGVLIGSFGTDENGQIRDERNFRTNINEASLIKPILAHEVPYIFQKNVPLYNDRSEIVDHGSVISAALWNGERTIGVIYMDNLLTQKPITERQGKFLTLYASTLGYSCTLKRTEEELRMMEEKRQKSQRLESIGILAGGIAHDYNNLLTGILGNTALAKMYCTSAVSSDRCSEGLSLLDKVIERLEDAEKASRRARDLTQQLLTFSRGGKPVKKVASISEILKDTARLALSGSDVKCEFSIPDDLWLLDIDEEQIRQVIKNLVLNADQAIPGSGIIEIRAENVTISPKNRWSLKSGKYVKIFVKDQGVGISKENLHKIFDPYFSTKGKVSQKGAGLGLAICHSIIEDHDGQISVESEQGVGTIFYIYLPAPQEPI